MEIIKHNKAFIILVILGIIIITSYKFYNSHSRQTISASGKQMVNVIKPPLSEDAKNGEVFFNKYCISCHGNNASGKQGLGPPLIHKIYEPNHHGDPSIYLAARSGVNAHHWNFGNMPPVKNIMDFEIEKIIKYIRELQKANGIIK